jgi:hypothetical protein
VGAVLQNPKSTHIFLVLTLALTIRVSVLRVFGNRVRENISAGKRGSLPKISWEPHNLHSSYKYC